MSRPSRPGSVRSPRRHLCAERRPEPFRAVCFCAVKPRTAFALRALSRAGRARWSPASLRSDRSPARRTATWRRLRRAAAKASGQADESQQDVGPAGVVHGALEAQPAAAGALRLVDHVPRCHVHQEGVAASEHLGVRKPHKANFGDVWELVRHTEEPRRLAGVSAAPRPVLEAGGGENVGLAQGEAAALQLEAPVLMAVLELGATELREIRGAFQVLTEWAKLWQERLPRHAPGRLANDLHPSRDVNVDLR